MNKNDEDGNSAIPESVGSSKEMNTVKSKGKNRGKKRKRLKSESSSDYEDILADNSVEVDRSLHASAIKNNLDETSVRKIIKKVVTNDRVLRLVKMREEEDSGTEESSLRPKLTRAKVKELMKVSPNIHSATAWNLENMELTPIKHIPVKTRPEVKALIAQELPEDEDDEEYEPTHDDVPSDDDQGLESCSDLDSQPRTPATPRSQHSTSPKVIKDGPFKVPQDISTPTRRKLDLEEEATIALRTRSKLSLSATSIEHIESTFIPPDDIPMPDVDDLWNQFLNECLNPASTSKNEDDDETDPEYNVAADPDAHDEDEESLGKSIIKISKKELNDLVTELFNIIPESTTEEELMADNLANSVLTEHSQGEVSSRWEGKQEPLSDDENGSRQKLSDRITFEKKNYSRVSTGKIDPEEKEAGIVGCTAQQKDVIEDKTKSEERTIGPRKPSTVVKVSVQEEEEEEANPAPPLLKEHLTKPAQRTEYVQIQVNQAGSMLPVQILILQQQLRQHVQLATSSYLQLYVHPIHWSYAGKYKEYLETFSKMVESNPKSVANVCNLKPAVELITTWEKTVSDNTPENREMIEFVQSETDRCLRRGYHKNLYVGEFHETFKNVVANSPVFLYPYLLPSMPYRGDHPRRFCYLHSEDELIALGLEQFWKFVADNPELYKPPMRRGSWGLSVTLQLVVKYMLPWLPFKQLHSHVQNVRKLGDKDNPINQYMLTRSVPPMKHKLLPYNPKLSLYEQPEHEVPRIWVRYLAKTSKRFRNYLNRRTNKTGVPAHGIDVEMGQAVVEPTKAALPIDLIEPIVPQPRLVLNEQFDIDMTKNAPIQVTNSYKLVETSTGAYLLPVTVTVNSNSGSITTPTEINSTFISDVPETSKKPQKNYQNTSEHCSCCIQLKKITKKQRQSVITDYFSSNKEKICGCKDKRYPKVSNRLRLLVNNHKYKYICALQELQMKIERLKEAKQDNTRLIDSSDTSNNDCDLDDIAYVTNFHLKLLSKTVVVNGRHAKRRIYNLLSKFNPYEQDPLQLAAQIKKACGTILEHLYKEFLVFLTPEQADKIDAFRDYFIRNCMADLVKKVEEQVSDVDKRIKILTELNKVFAKNVSTACEICTDLLCTLDGYPTLAQYVHSLFPHRKENIPEQKDSTPPLTQESSQLTEKSAVENAIIENSIRNNTMAEKTTMDYEADMSMSEEENNGGSKNHSDSENNRQVCRPIKLENTTEYVTPTSESVSLLVTVSKTEVQDFSDCSDSSMQIMFDEEIVKTENPEWKRDEDKLILEILKEYLTPEERRDKTILEIVEEKNIIGMISDSLADKSIDDIETRILYLLQIL